MNNKGFGLRGTLVICSLFMFILVVITIYCHKEFNKNTVLTQEQEMKIADPIINPNVEEECVYKVLEKKLLNAAKNYKINNSNDKIIITLKTLQQNYLIGKINDPINEGISCNGYVIYTSNTNSYKSYLKCDGMYATINYNSELE